MVARGHCGWLYYLGYGALAAFMTATVAACGGSDSISVHSPWQQLQGTGGIEGRPGSMWFDDAQHGWFVNEDRPGVWITNDGGRSWQSCEGTVQGTPKQLASLPRKISALPCPRKILRLGNILYVAFNVRPPGFEDPAPEEQYAGIIVSRNEGVTWSRCLTLPASKEWMLDFCAGEGTLYALCGPRDPDKPSDHGVPTYLLRSSDGGQSWKRLPQPAGIDGGTTVLLPPLTFVDDLHAWSACETTEPNGWVFVGDLLTTVDGGKSWKKVTGEVGGGPLFVFDAAHAWTTGGGFNEAGVGSAACVATSDGGKSWHVLHELDDIMLSGIFFADLQHGWVQCGGGFLATSDGGKTWVEEGETPDNYGGDWTFFLTDTRLFASSGSLLLARKLP